MYYFTYFNTYLFRIQTLNICIFWKYVDKLFTFQFNLFNKKKIV